MARFPPKSGLGTTSAAISVLTLWLPGAGSTVGGISVNATTSNSFYVQSYGCVIWGASVTDLRSYTDESNAKVWVILICRDPLNTISVDVDLASVIPGSISNGQVYRFTKTVRLALVTNQQAVRR
jgi:hypothetical protein